MSKNPIARQFRTIRGKNGADEGGVPVVHQPKISRFLPEGAELARETVSVFIIVVGFLDML
jgi:hypothetical protein